MADQKKNPVKHNRVINNKLKNYASKSMAQSNDELDAFPVHSPRKDDTIFDKSKMSYRILPINDTQGKKISES